ncbi:MAG: TetR/AcrR family transcriptional regulator [Beijerinckiaceae bacterium]|jgi:TetR/AcrR family transcriptional repressor of nem operon|nr:TetR/AcrR family transcriptional regulator [Beijerinckiaceae bacterium]
MIETSAREQILDAAEKRARMTGYHGFSFRDVADDVGIKSSSVHYHFPTKGDLCEALARRYTVRAVDRLGDPRSLAPGEGPERVAALFRDALLIEDRMCLCGLFGSQRDALPTQVATTVAAFFQMILDYLDAAPKASRGSQNSAALLARLEGALILARTLNNPSLFEDALRETAA